MSDNKINGCFSDGPSSSVNNYRHNSEVICCGATKDRVVGVALLIFSFMVGTAGGWILYQGMGFIPPMATGAAFSLVSLGLLAVSIVMLARKNNAIQPSREPSYVVPYEDFF